MLRSVFNQKFFNKIIYFNSNIRNQSNGIQNKKSLLNIGLISGSAALALGAGGAFIYQYKKSSKLEEDIFAQKSLNDGRNREMKALQKQLSDLISTQQKLEAEREKIQEEKDTNLSGVEKDSQEILNDNEKSEDKSQTEKPQVENIDDKLESDFRVSLEKKYQKMLKKYRENLEEELRHHLKRQLAAHNDHLQEQLHLLAREMERKNQIVLEDSLLQERIRYESELSDSIHRLHTIEAILKIRDQLDKDERTAKELWLACQILRDALKYTPSNISGQPMPKSLSTELKTIRQTLKEYTNDSVLASVALESISDQVLDQGVYSEDDLINRFTKIDRICKRVALVGDQGGSLFKYILSYVQSFLLFDERKIPLEELNDHEIDPTKLDTFNILSRIRHCLKRNNLELALRYANQLKGQPRQVAKDWIKDTRVHLEIKQVADILLNQAASISAQVLQ